MTQNQQFPAGLPENEALFRSMIEGLAEGVIIADLEEVALYCNDRICEMTGYTREEIISKRCYDLVATPEQGQEMLRLNKQRKQGSGDYFEMLLHKKDGTPIWMEIHVNPYRNASGEVTSTLSAWSDITGRKQAEAALHKLNEELESRVQARTVQLAEQNHLLLGRDRILEATASAANALLTIENFDSAVNTALQIIGDSLDTDRVAVLENFDNLSEQAYGYSQVVYEWNSPYAVSQFAHSEVSRISYEGLEDLYQLFSQGYVNGGLIDDEILEPLRVALRKVDVKSTYSVPIFVDGKFWGLVGFDDCREAKRRNPAELAVLKIAADCIGSAIQRDRDRRDREEAELMVLLEREKAATERAAELAKANEALRQRDRLLSTVAAVSKDLLESAEVDSAITQALKQIGEAAGISRVELMQQELEAATARLHHRVLVEWTALGVPRQSDDPATKVVYNDEYGVLVDELHAGRSIWHTIDEFPEPARTQQKGISVKSTGAVPIFIEDSYYGCVGFDDCVDYRQWSAQEIDVLAAAAGVIGAALHRKQLVERLIAERARAVEERAAELAKANEALKKSLDTLATEPELDKFLGYVLTEIAQQTEACAAYLFLYSPEANTLSLCTVVKDGKLYFEPAPDDPQMFQHPFDADITPVWQSLLIDRTICLQTIATQDEWTWEETKAWHITQKHSAHAGIALVAGDHPVGFLGMAWRHKTTLTTEQTELVHALSNQATLAIQLTRLAEKAKLVAIAREREKDAMERADELAKANLALQRCVEKISQDSSLEKLLSHVLVEAVNLSSACGGGLFVQQSPANEFHPIAIIENGVLRSGEDWLAQRGIERFVERSATDETGFFKQLTQGKINYLRVDEPDGLWWADLIAYHQQFGHRVVMHIPMMLHGKVLGLFTLCFKQVIEPKPEVIQYLTTLTNQATLALELTRLAEQAKEKAQQNAVFEERNRIAREIHDTLAQGFTGVIIQLEATKRKISSAQLEAAQTHITRARSLAAEGLCEARRSVQALRPEPLESRNLPGALCHLAEQMTCAPTTQITVGIEGSPYALPVEIEINLLRIAQEAVTNALRHAQAQTIHIKLSFESAAVHLQITDDGQGFDPESQLMNRGFGLIGMQERSHHLGGQFTLTSSIGQGTKIIVTILTPVVKSRTIP